MRFGVTAQTVKRRMALGRVSPVLLVHYQKGDLSLEALQAYTLTDDHARQEAAYAGLGYSASGTAHGPFAVPMHSPMTEYFLDADGRGATRPRRGVAGARFEIANVWFRSFDLSKRTDRKPPTPVIQLSAPPGLDMAGSGGSALGIKRLRCRHSRQEVRCQERERRRLDGLMQR